jgi:hypothetical protein
MSQFQQVGFRSLPSSAPEPVDPTRARRDLLYRSWPMLLHDGKRELFESSDLLFVAAGIEHQIEDISEDFAMWRLFYGPPGGEVSV